MIKDYIKEFDTDSEYQSYIAGDPVLPNVSYIVETNGVEFKPYVPPRMDIITYTASAKLKETTSQWSGGLHTNAFSGTSGQLTITSHTFENGVGTIEFNDDVTSIGEHAFSSCRGLTSVTIPNSVTTIRTWAISYCKGLTSITIPNSVTSISYAAFEGSYVPSTNFVNNSSLDEVANNYWGAKFYDTNIDGFLIRNNVVVKYIGTSNTITIPNSVTSIGDNAFQYCEDLTSVTIPNSVTSIGELAFCECTGLTSITIPDSVTSIGDGAFGACTGLTSVTIGSGVTSIGQYAFQGCTGLTSITCNAMTAPTVHNYTFEEIKQFGTLYVPTGSTGYDGVNTWMGMGDYYLGYYYWRMVEQ